MAQLEAEKQGFNIRSLGALHGEVDRNKGRLMTSVRICWIVTVYLVFSFILKETGVLETYLKILLPGKRYKSATPFHK